MNPLIINILKVISVILQELYLIQKIIVLKLTTENRFIYQFNGKYKTIHVRRLEMVFSKEFDHFAKIHPNIQNVYVNTFLKSFFRFNLMEFLNSFLKPEIDLRFSSTNKQ